MTEKLNDQAPGDDADVYYLNLLKNESVSGAIQILLIALFDWSRVCHHLQIESLEISQFTVTPSVTPRAARQEVYNGLKEVDYTSREERWSHWEPYPVGANADDDRLAQHIVDYATTLSFEDAVTFFVKLISQWIKMCSVEAVLEDLEQNGRNKHINQPITESELVRELERSLYLISFDYESMDA